MNQIDGFLLIFSVLLLIAVIMSLYGAGIVWRRRDVPGLHPFLTLAVSAAIWCGAYFLELNSAAPELKLFWARVQYFGIAMAPPAMFFFALEFSGVKRWSWRWFLPAGFTIPLFIIFLIWTNDLHSLIWSQIELIETGGAPILSFSYGPMFWVHASFTYALLLVSSLLMLRIIYQGDSLYSSQAGMIFWPW